MVYSEAMTNLFPDLNIKITGATTRLQRLRFQVLGLFAVLFLGWHGATHAALNCADGQYLVRAELIDYFQPAASGDGMTGIGYLEDANGFAWLTFGDLPAWTTTPLFSIQEVCVPLGTYTFAYFVDEADLYPEELFFWVYVNDVEVLFGGGGMGDNYYSTTAGDFYLDMFWVKEGCTNPTATNYDPQAPVDDGSCVCPNNADAIDLSVTIFDSYGEGNDGFGFVTDLEDNILYLTDIYWNQNCESYGYLSAEDWQTYCSGNLSQTNGPYALCPGDYIFNHNIEDYPEEFSFELSTENETVGFGNYNSLPYPFQLGGADPYDAGGDMDPIEEIDSGTSEVVTPLDAGNTGESENDSDAGQEGDDSDINDAGDTHEPILPEDAGATIEVSPQDAGPIDEEPQRNTQDAGLIGVELLPPTTSEPTEDSLGAIQMGSGCQCRTHHDGGTAPFGLGLLLLAGAWHRRRRK